MCDFSRFFKSKGIFTCSFLIFLFCFTVPFFTQVSFLHIPLLHLFPILLLLFPLLLPCFSFPFSFSSPASFFFSPLTFFSLFLFLLFFPVLFHLPYYISLFFFLAIPPVISHSAQFLSLSHSWLRSYAVPFFPLVYTRSPLPHPPSPP